MKVCALITIRDKDGDLLDSYSHTSELAEEGPDRGISFYSALRQVYPEGSQIKIEVFR